MNGRERTAERGVTLVEAVVATGVFGIALLGLNLMLFATLRTSQHARDFSTARFLAGHRLEQLKSARYQDGDRDAYRDPTDPCTDIDEVIAGAFPDEDYGAVDLLNGTQFTYRTCAAVPDIKQTGKMMVRADYPTGAQGDLDFQVNHLQYGRFRREVYIVDSASYTDAITGVGLGPPNPQARDAVIVNTTSPTEEIPASRYIKYILVRVKWKDLHGQLHQVTLSTEKAFYIPSF